VIFIRIVSICPSNTELVASLGLTDSLVGVDDFSDWPRSVTHLPQVGPDLSINMDKVELLKPDIVLASLSVPGMEKNIENLKSRNIPYVTFNPQSLEDIWSDLVKLGEITGIETQARQKAEEYREIVRNYKSLAKNTINKQKLYWEWWPKPVFTPGKINWLTEISHLAGGVNLFADIELASVQTNWEDVLRRKPDHICMVWVGVKTNKMNPDIVKRRPGWDVLEAVQHNKIHVLEESLFCRPSPRLLDGLEKITTILQQQD
jgi:iron complex transport system substrate-binding protein